MKIKFVLTVFAGLFLASQAQSQNLPAENAFAFKLKEPIQLDGILDEAIWTDPEGWNGNFRQYFPSDTSKSPINTRVKLAFDAENLYIAAVMENNGPRNYVSTSLRRDFRGEQNDAIVFVLDTFNDKTNAFQFGVNPYGVQREGLVANGGTRAEDLSLAWDNKWFSEAKIFEQHWQVEVVIPLSTLRFNEGAQNWNVNFYRIDSHYGERSTWSPIPRNIPIISTAFLQKLIFEEPLKKKGSANVSLIPWRQQVARYLACRIPQKHMVRKWRGILSRRGVSKGCDWLERGNCRNGLWVVNPSWVMRWIIKWITHGLNPF